MVRQLIISSFLRASTSSSILSSSLPPRPLLLSPSLPSPFSRSLSSSSSSTSLTSPLPSPLSTPLLPTSSLLQPLSSPSLSPSSPLSKKIERCYSGGVREQGGGEGGVSQGGGVTHMTPSITILRGKDGQEIFLVGTHLSEESADLVEEVISTVKPANVFLELCEKRAKKLEQGHQLQQYDAFQSASWIEDMLKKMGHHVPESYFKIMQAYSQAIGLVPGAEFKRAMKMANETRARVIFGDIDGDTTMYKIGNAITLTSLFQMMNSAKTFDRSIMNEPVAQELARKLQDPHTSVEEKAQVLKNREFIRIFTRVASKISPESARALLNDRDEHMCGGLLDLKGETTVAIVGMAHMDGIEAEWKKRSGLA